jgi:putative IMPACT (imprinted ancient) family translation regulator
MVAPYFTLNQTSEGLFKDRGSAFHAMVVPVDSPESFQEAMAAWVARHRGARHHAWAFRIRSSVGLEERSHDAGEPNHSAGTPILHALQSYEVQDVGAVVTRYFGGVKLGVGGLITAYRGAAEDALEHAERILCHPEALAELELPYELLGRMEADATDPRIRWIERHFGAIVTLKVAVWAEAQGEWEAHWNQCYPLKWNWVAKGQSLS